MLLKNATILQQGKEILTDILIENSKIAKIEPALSSTHNNQIIDLDGKHVLPGLIDSHVHFRDPGLTHKEDFRTGTMAAAAGGITTVLDMPNTIPPTISTALLEEKKEGAKKALINYGFHFGSTVDNIDEVYAAKNIASVKIYMNDTTGKLLITDHDALERLFASKRMIAAHAEEETMEYAISLAKKYNTRLYIVHVSSAREVQVLRALKQSTPQHEQHIFAETTPHHLLLSAPSNDDPFKNYETSA